MGNWISLQRTALSKGKVAEDRKTRLADLGIYPFGSTKMPYSFWGTFSSPALDSPLWMQALRMV